jgi:sn-1 stearoyl-lipid 9-desaturase
MQEGPVQSSVCDSFLNRLLDPPHYGFTKNGSFYRPTPNELWREFFSRINIFASRKNWLPLFSWMVPVTLSGFFFVFAFNYLSLPLFIAGFLFSMVYMGSFGTFWLHRYSTHQAFRIKNKFFVGLLRNFSLPIIPEEIYVLSHHVHHAMSEKPGDPYNVHGGGLYCFLADANHQMINPNLSEADYARATKLLAHTGIYMNTYSQYQTWGSICHPARTLLRFVMNWSAFYFFFYSLGGHALATALFGGAAFWAFGVRTYNYAGHGSGRDQRRDGIDFNRADWSVNQTWPGFVAGEWHNNHHLYPNGARSGFFKSQVDLPWYFIKGLHKIGIVPSYRDYQQQFMEKYVIPYRASKEATPELVPDAVIALQTTPPHQPDVLV